MHYGNRFDGKGKRERERETGMFWEHVKYCKRGKKQQRAREVAKVLIQVRIVATKNRMDYLRGKHTFRCLKGSICGDQQLHGIQKMTD